MAKRQTGAIQRRTRAGEQRPSRGSARTSTIPIAGRRSGGVDWRLWAIAGVLGIGAVAVVVFVLLQMGGGSTIGVAVANAGQEHIEDGTQPPAGSYTSVPATSGPHWNAPANWGVYPSGAGVPEAQAIHNLEHGGIVIWYDPDRASSEAISELDEYVNRELSGNRYKFILSPWDGEDFNHAIAVTAWTRLLYLDSVDMALIGQFVDRYYQRLAPEPGGGPGPPR